MHVEPAESQDHLPNRRGNAGSRREIDLDRHARIGSSRLPRLGPHRFGARALAVGNDDVRAAGGELQRRLAADTAAAADNQRHGAAQFALGRLPPQFRFFKRPVLDAKRLRSRQRNVVMKGARHGRPGILQRRRTCHDVKSVDEELGRDSRLALVFAKSKHAEPGQ